MNDAIVVGLAVFLVGLPVSIVLDRIADRYGDEPRRRREAERAECRRFLFELSERMEAGDLENLTPEEEDRLHRMAAFAFGRPDERSRRPRLFGLVSRLRSRRRD